MNRHSGQNDEMRGIISIFRAARSSQDLSQKEVSRTANIGIHRFRKLEGQIGSYALQPMEADHWASALGFTLEEARLEASGFYDVLPRERHRALFSHVGIKDGEETFLEASPAHASQLSDADEALVWKTLSGMTDLSIYDETYRRPSRWVEMDGWVKAAREVLRNDNDPQIEELDRFPLYADWLCDVEHPGA